MTRVLVRWMTRLSLGLLLTVAVVIAALIAMTGGRFETAVLFALVVVDPFTTRPLLRMVCSHRGTGRGDDNRKSTAILEQAFAVGTNETQLKSTLLGQGFKPTPPHDCLRQGQVWPVAKTVYTCPSPSRDQSKELRYQWGRFLCGRTILICGGPGITAGSLRSTQNIPADACSLLMSWSCIAASLPLTIRRPRAAMLTRCGDTATSRAAAIRLRPRYILSS